MGGRLLVPWQEARLCHYSLSSQGDDDDDDDDDDGGVVVDDDDTYDCYDGDIGGLCQGHID